MVPRLFFLKGGKALRLTNMGADELVYAQPLLQLPAPLHAAHTDERDRQGLHQ